jgi:hypothetical protein
MTASENMMTPLPFLNEASALDLKNRLYANKARAIVGPDDQLFGCPMDYEERFVPNYLQILHDHNVFMKETFPDVIERIKNFFTDYLGSHCYYADDVGFPGFRIFTIPPKRKRSLWFHNDFVNDIFEKQFPRFGVKPTSRLYTFIVLLDDPEGLTAGLLYVPDKKIGDKIMSFVIPRHNEFETFAQLHVYKKGEINILKACTHSIYARNDSDQVKERVTLQGHLIETPSGFLIFW